MLVNIELYKKRKKFYEEHIVHEKQAVVDCQEMLNPPPEDIPIAKRGFTEHKRKLDSLQQRLEELTLLEECLKPLLSLTLEN